MKNLLTMAAGLGAVIVLGACQSPDDATGASDYSNDKDTAAASVEATIQPVTLNVTGMT